MKRILFLVLIGLLAFYVGWPAFSGWQLHAALERGDSATVARKVDFPAVRKALEPVVVREVGSGMDRYLADLGPLAGMLGPVLKQQYAPRVVEATLNTLITPENIVRIYAEKDDMRSAAEKILMEELGKPGGLFSGLLGGGRTGDGSPSLADRMKLPGGLGGLGESLQKQIGGLSGLGGAGGGQGGGAGSGALAPEVPDMRTVLTKMIEASRKARGARPLPETTSQPPSTGGGFGIGNVKRFAFNGPLAMEVGVAAKASAPASDVVAEMAFTGGDWKVTRLVPGF
jgi:hypothetical protein